MTHEVNPLRRGDRNVGSLVIAAFAMIVWMLAGPTEMANAQSDAVSGVVVDLGQKPLPGVAVSAELPDGSRRSTTTDETGTYRFSSAAVNGELTIKATASDGASQTIRVNIEPGTRVEIPPMALRTGAVQPSVNELEGVSSVEDDLNQLAFSGTGTDAAMLFGGLVLLSGAMLFNINRSHAEAS